MFETFIEELLKQKNIGPKTVDAVKKLLLGYSYSITNRMALAVVRGTKEIIGDAFEEGGYRSPLDKVRYCYYQYQKSKGLKVGKFKIAKYLPKI